MRKKGGSGMFAVGMEEALAPLLFFLFVILLRYLSITNPLLSAVHFFHLSLVLFNLFLSPLRLFSYS